MAESHNRIRLALVVAVLIGVATVSMVVDRRALGSGGRDLPWWSAAVLDVAVPVQKMVEQRVVRRVPTVTYRPTVTEVVPVYTPPVILYSPIVW